MLDGGRDDASYWTNFTPGPSAAEAERLVALTGDPRWAAELLAYGFRPYGRLDIDPYGQPSGLKGPWQPSSDDLADGSVVADLQTGWCFHYNANERSFSIDLGLSDNYLDAQVLLFKAAHRVSPFTFDWHAIAAAEHPLRVTGPYPVTHPTELRASNLHELHDIADQLRRLFCGSCGARRLWFRGQREEYTLPRSRAISEAIYGKGWQPSLHPSLGRYAVKHPEKMSFAFSFLGPNHDWKKPFLVWMMRENAHWFVHEPRCLEALEAALRNPDDSCFARLLGQIQLSPLETGDPPFLSWPDEADDLRQWFFAHMKRYEFGVTLQQYGYYSSLLDLTEDIDVALYFTQARFVDNKMRKQAPHGGRIIYVFAERSRANVFAHGGDLFWGSDGWVKRLPPRLERQKAGFMAGSTNRTQNFYANMIVARIHLGANDPETSLADEDLFPRADEDCLFKTLGEARPSLEGLY